MNRALPYLRGVIRQIHEVKERSRSMEAYKDERAGNYGI